MLIDQPINPTQSIPIGRVEEWLLKYLDRNREFATRQMQQTWQEIRLSQLEYTPYNSADTTGKQEQKQNQTTDIPEMQNQVDIVKANFYENFFQNSQSYTLVAKGGETQSRADTTKQVADNMLDESDFDLELEDSLHRYVDHPAGGLKYCIHYKSTTESERISVPASEESVLEVAAMSNDSNIPARPIGISENMNEAMYEVPQTSEEQLQCYLQSIDILRTAFPRFIGTTRPQDQPSVHEYHYWTTYDLSDYGGFKNLDKLGAANANNRKYPLEAGGQEVVSTTSQTPSDFEQYEICETWIRIPWDKGLQKDFSQEELLAFFEHYGVDPLQQFVPQKWQCFHKNSEVLLKICDNYKKKKLEHPYWYASFYPNGHSYAQRIRPLVNKKKALETMFIDNVKVKLYQSLIVNSNSEIDDDILKKLYEPKGRVELDLGNLPIEDKILFFGDKIPDMTAGVMSGIALVNNELQSFGIPAAVQGYDQSDTATQGSMNNARGQQKLNSPFRRYVKHVFKPALRDMLDGILINFNEPQWIMEAGEDGAAMAKQKYVTPDQITDKFEIIPLATYDFADRNVKAQQLLGLLNVDAGSGMLTPELYMKTKAAVMEFQGFRRSIINECTDNYGKGTDPQDEIRTMILDPNTEIRVRPDDNHELCLILGNQAAMEFPQLGAQFNFNQYMQMHQFYYTQILTMQMQAEQQAQEGKPGASKGKPKQQPKNSPTSPEGTDARQPGQLGSAPDNGMMTNAGMTGQAGMGALLV